MAIVSRVVRVQLIALVTASLILTLGPAAPRATAETELVAASGSRLTRPDGSPLFLLGVNYVGGPDRSWTMWQDGRFDAGLVEQDLLMAKTAGFNTVRVFIRPPLDQELRNGQWGKLDTVVALAEKHGIYLIITLYDYREDDLAKVGELNRAIAQRYADRVSILAYDLRNEPHYQNLAIAQYPGSPAPLQTDVLIKHYGERLTPAAANEWRQGEGQGQIPDRFSPQEAYIYANSYLIYREFLSDLGAWVAARNYDVTSLDYMRSPDSAKWQPLITVLDQTLAAWLKPQIDAVRAVDSRRLITVGYSDAILAALPANNVLGFVSIHRFPNPGLKPLNVVFDLLDDLRGIFPDKPVVLEEFGYSNAGTESHLTAVYETAMLLDLLGKGIAGGAKWSLYDVVNGDNPREMNFGVYRADGGIKPIVLATRAVGDYIAAGQPPGGMLSLSEGSSSSEIRYVYTSPNALFVGAPSYADPNGRLSYELSGAGQVFVSWASGNQIDIVATAPATIRINPAALVGAKTIRDVSLVRSDGTPAQFQREGDSIVLGAEAGQRYHLRFTPLAIDGRIEIVWPHGGRPVSEAERANVTAYLFEQGTSVAICPSITPTVRLYRTLNNSVEHEVAVGQPRGLQLGARAFTAWDFNDLDVAAARDPNNRLFFRLSIDGYPHRSSIWSHAVDARTYLPTPDVPTGVTTSVPQEVDAKIQIVWPHDNLPVDQASLVNVAVYLFEHGTLQSVPADWSPTVRLWRALNNGYEEPVAVGAKVMKQAGEITFPAWEFNNVDVSAARDPRNKYYFRVTIDGVASHSNIWSHGADPRSYFPQIDVPSGVGACN